jgi:hypothetical protein
LRSSHSDEQSGMWVRFLLGFIRPLLLDHAREVLGAVARLGHGAALAPRWRHARVAVLDLGQHLRRRLALVLVVLVGEVEQRVLVEVLDVPAVHGQLGLVGREVRQHHDVRRVEQEHVALVLAREADAVLDLLQRRVRHVVLRRAGDAEDDAVELLLHLDALGDA